MHALTVKTQPEMKPNHLGVNTGTVVNLSSSFIAADIENAASDAKAANEEANIATETAHNKLKDAANAILEISKLDDAAIQERDQKIEDVVKTVKTALLSVLDARNKKFKACIAKAFETILHKKEPKAGDIKILETISNGLTKIVAEHENIAKNNSKKVYNNKNCRIVTILNETLQEYSIYEIPICELAQTISDTEVKGGIINLEFPDFIAPLTDTKVETRSRDRRTAKLPEM